MITKATFEQIDWPATFKALPWQAILAKAPFWTSMLLVVLIANAAADMTWLLFSPTSTVTGTKHVVPVSQQTGEQARLQGVADLHLFGVADSKAPVVEAPIDAPKTSLKLVLRGVFSSDDPDRAMAIIADAGGDEKLYRVGTNVPGGAKVHTIYPDRVILERNGRFETLNLPRDGLPENALITRSAPSTEPIRERTVQAPDKLKEMRDMLKNDPQKLWQQVRIEPVLKEGKIVGYRLSHNDAQLMRALGINKTDVITAVNGYPLDDPSVLYELMSQFDTASEIRLTVERNGGSEVLVVHM